MSLDAGQGPALPTGPAGPVPAASRDDGLDAFRALGIFGIILAHVYQLTGQAWSPGVESLMRVRASALPIVILISFYVFARSRLRSTGRPFGQFAARRFWRVGVPCLVWTAVFWTVMEVVAPIAHGGGAAPPPWTIWLSGYGHLWFLQFLLAGAILAYPLVRFFARYPRYAWVFAAACVGVAGAYACWLRPYLLVAIRQNWVDAADASLRIAIRQSIAHAHYIPLGVSLALVSDTLTALHSRRWFRAVTVAAAAAALLVHVAMAIPGVSRAIYSVTLFVALLRPWRAGALAWLAPAAKYSYPIYIVHPFLARGAAAALGGVTLSAAGLVAASAAVFAASGLVSGVLRRAVPADWFLPLVPVKSGWMRAGLTR